jgi:hypothetical protein
MTADPDTAILALRAAAAGRSILGDRWVAWLNWQYLHDRQFRAAMPREPVRVSRYDEVIFPPPHLVTFPPGATPRLINMPPVLIDRRFGQRPSRRVGRPPDTALPTSLRCLMAETPIEEPGIFLAALAGIATPRPGQTRKSAIHDLAMMLGGDQGEHHRIRTLIARTVRRTRTSTAAAEDQVEASVSKTCEFVR